MTDTYRALCAEIIDAHDADEGMSVSRWTANLSAVINRARAALETQPEPVAPTDEELLSMRSWSCHGPTFDSDLVDFARAVLARYGTPANNTREEHTNYD